MSRDHLWGQVEVKAAEQYRKHGSCVHLGLRQMMWAFLHAFCVSAAHRGKRCFKIFSRPHFCEYIPLTNPWPMQSRLPSLKGRKRFALRAPCRHRHCGTG